MLGAVLQRWTLSLSLAYHSVAAREAREGLGQTLDGYNIKSSYKKSEWLRERSRYGIKLASAKNCVRGAKVEGGTEKNRRNAMVIMRRDA